MGIDRGVLSRIDRKLLARLETDEEWRVARLPISEALWSAWKRYCLAIDISMGRGIAALVQRELETVIGAELDENLLSEIESRLHGREEAVDDYERRLRDRELSIQQREHFLSITDSLTGRSQASKVGRNDRCLCGSGLKYKRCHGR
jgi:uncharacterized protein YecA (UPF0149 family)